MKSPIQSLAAAMPVALAAMLVPGVAAAQANVFKLGVTEYTTHSQTTGITGIGVPPGADATTGDAATAILTYERMLTPHIGAEFVIGVPPRIKADAAGSVAFLGKDVLSAKILSPTFFMNYHFGEVGDTWRPYVGAGANYTKFVSVESSIASEAKLGDSMGWAAQAGMDYALDKQWGLFASVAALRVRSSLVASGATVLQTTIDFRPIVYSFGASYRF